MRAGSYIYSYVSRLFSKIYQIKTLQTALKETLTMAFRHQKVYYKSSKDTSRQEESSSSLYGDETSSLKYRLQ